MNNRLLKAFDVIADQVINDPELKLTEVVRALKIHTYDKAIMKHGEVPSRIARVLGVNSNTAFVHMEKY